MEIYPRGSEWRRWDLHLHTASSYDYQYKGEDADQLLCEALHNNNIKAVAITDHFIIDSDRIKRLRSLASDITFFPGVELRTDKGAPNLHMILIFPEDSDLNVLSQDFESVMLRGKAKHKESNEKIYWIFEDIVKFAKDYNALITIHAGHKSNGVDERIINSVPVNEAIKEDIAENVNFFEIGQIRDVDDYENVVFNDIERKPLILCSDCHNPKKYNPKESLWIKADLTFEGLKQCTYQPLERVYIGVIPPLIDRINKNKQVNIDTISVDRIDKPNNASDEWFDFSLPLNPGMVAIIGNKGSGKSAFSDIVGHLCKCHTMKYASFLNESRFRKSPKNYAGDYTGSIRWADGEEYKSNLDTKEYDTVIEDAQYLPQKYIEDVCNDISGDFQKEIDNVIFSYVDRSEKGNSKDLEELVSYKSKSNVLTIRSIRQSISDINAKIIALEDKKTTEYQKSIADGLKKTEQILDRHEKSKPVEVQKPEYDEDDEEYRKHLSAIDERITTTKQTIDNHYKEIDELNNYINDLTTIIADIESIERNAYKVNDAIDVLITKHNLDTERARLQFSSPKEYLDSELTKAMGKKVVLKEMINNPKSGLSVTLEKLEKEKEDCISSADSKERLYQKYLDDLADWEEKRKSIIGDQTTEGTLEFYKNEELFIQEKLEMEYNKLIRERDVLLSDLYQELINKVKIYESIYSPIESEVESLLSETEDRVTFKAEISVRDYLLKSYILRSIDHRYSGLFGKIIEAEQLTENLIKTTIFSDKDSVINFVHEMNKATTEDLDVAKKKVTDRHEFYDYIYGLDYINILFKLKVGDRYLDELSPGERGIVLLIFYLALSKKNIPIIIDQPEDNLDNQSVFSKLVPCICKAKTKRQVIIVTHNPNIAVACDAEQIIYCEISKTNNHIKYVSGSIENQIIKQHVIDVLEGTRPAFDLRKLKYDQ